MPAFKILNYILDVIAQLQHGTESETELGLPFIEISGDEITVRQHGGSSLFQTYIQKVELIRNAPFFLLGQAPDLRVEYGQKALEHSNALSQRRIGIGDLT